MDEVNDELRKKLDEIKSLYSQRHYDEALSSIQETLSEFGDVEQVDILKQEIEDEINQIIRETQTYNREGHYRSALKNIDEILLMNPNAFKTLKKEKKTAEKGVKDQLGKAKKSYKSGDREKALSLLEDLFQISGSEVIEANRDEIQEMLEDLRSEEAPGASPPETEETPESPPLKKKDIEKKYREALNKLEEKDFDSARILLSEVTASDPENRNAQNLLNILNLEISKIPNLFWQNKFDDALLAISVQLAKNPDNQELQSYKWRIQSQVAQKIEEIKKALAEDEYNYALSEIRDALKKNPVAFKELEGLRQKASAMAEGRSPEEVIEEIPMEEPEEQKSSKSRLPIFLGASGIIAAAVVLFLLFAGGDKEKAPLTGQLLLSKAENLDTADLTATVDESPINLENPQPTELQPGIHTLSFKKEDRVYTKEISISEGTTTTFSIPLHPLTINISPRGELWQGDILLRERGSTHTLSLLPGEYTFSIRAEGYIDQTREVVVPEQEAPSPINISLNPIPPDPPGTLRIQLMPSGRAYEGGRLLATFPPLQQDISLSPGTHTLRFTTNEEDCEERVLSFRIASRTVRSATIYLCFGLLNVNTIPPGARISIDGKAEDVDGNPFGTTPRANIKLPKGLHTLTVEHPDYPSKTVQVIIQTDQTVNSSVDLTKRP